MPRLWSPPETDAVAPEKRAVLAARLDAIAARAPRLALAFSLQAEDVLLLAMLKSRGIGAAALLLETGELDETSLAFADEIEAALNVTITRLSPEPNALAALNAVQDLSAIYESLAAREACCRVRKVAPLASGVIGFDALITGQRRSQSLSRAHLAFEEASAQPVKFNPLADWTSGEVWAETRRLGLPRHPLYARGYASISCAPCTRPVREGEHERAGRWWWEENTAKECGLHRSAAAETIA